MDSSLLAPTPVPSGQNDSGLNDDAVCDAWGNCYSMDTGTEGVFTAAQVWQTTDTNDLTQPTPVASDSGTGILTTVYDIAVPMVSSTPSQVVPETTETKSVVKLSPLVPTFSADAHTFSYDEPITYIKTIPCGTCSGGTTTVLASTDVLVVPNAPPRSSSERRAIDLQPMKDIPAKQTATITGSSAPTVAFPAPIEIIQVAQEIASTATSLVPTTITQILSCTTCASGTTESVLDILVPLPTTSIPTSTIEGPGPHHKGPHHPYRPHWWTGFRTHTWHSGSWSLE